MMLSRPRRLPQSVTACCATILLHSGLGAAQTLSFGQRSAMDHLPPSPGSHLYCQQLAWEGFLEVCPCVVTHNVLAGLEAKGGRKAAQRLDTHSPRLDVGAANRAQA